MPKKRVPDPKILRCHGLKNDRAILDMATILALPCKWIVLPLPMHAVNTSYHSRKSSFLIDRQQPSSVLNSGLSKIDDAKNRYHRSAELEHRLKAGGLIRKYSSMRSPATPYASMRIDAEHFYRK
jgi:hypothetical protein